MLQPIWKKREPAVHEACHAVVAHECRKVVTICSIGGDPEGKRRTNVEGAIDWEGIDTKGWTDQKAIKRVRHRIRRLLKNLVAGEIGENLEYRKPRLSDTIPADYLRLVQAEVAIPGLRWGNTDLVRVMFLIQERMRLPIGPEFAKAEERADRIVRRRWRRVIHLAKRVYDRGYLDGPALAAALRY